ncbi:MAG: prepilin-type N-terminal cleavage/methylation domain-containing protein [Pseudomonadota bacterium]|nr:prepilin-type N-terminal cleavage/methylation domain-containing protein [Pseudomonadota bacterium]
MRKGFSLVELMLTVGIIGVLAAIAVPNFQTMVLKARKAEALTNLRGIGDASVAHFAAHDAWVTASTNPGSPIGKTARPWRTGQAGWVDLGWSPDGLVRCTYMVTQFGGGTWVRADAYCDVDDDNVSSIIRYYVATADREGYFSDLYPSRY